jgi:hypothetical protein
MALGIPSIDEARRSLAGVWQLFLGRQSGLALLDTSFDGFWRSFGVFYMLAPLNGILILTEIRLIEAGDTAPEDGVSLLPFALLKFLNLGIELVAFPILLLLMSGFLGVRATFVPYVVARNWSIPIALAITLFPAMLFAAGLIGRPIAELLLFAGLIVALRFHYMVLRLALAASVGLAITLLVLDFVLSMLVSDLIARASGVG